MDTRADEGVASLDSFLPGGLEDAYPMSELQVGMVYEMERDPDRLPYHNVHTLRMSGSFDESCFRGAVALVVARHPILRTAFDLVGFGEPMQLVYDAAQVPILVADLRALSDDEAREALSAYIRTERRTPLNVAVAPLCRMGIHVLSDDAYQWTFTEHHAILDGWSLASVVAEITDLYRRLVAGEQPPTVPIESTYRDFIAAEREALASPQSRDFWRDLLAELPDGRLPRWPADRPSVLTSAPAPGERHVHDEKQGFGSLISPLPPQLTPRLRELARACRVPLKSVLLATHLKVMSLVTGSADVVAGLTSNGRLEEAADGAEVCGLFVNTLPFRMRLAGGSWRELIRSVFDAENEMLPHRRYPMAALQRELGGSQLFETNFVFTDFQQIDDIGAAEPEEDPESEHESFAEVSRTHFALVVAFNREAGAEGLSLELEYDARALPAAQLSILRDYYVRVMEAMAADPAATHQWATLLGADERAQLEAWNSATADVPSVPVHRLVEERAAASPDAVALEMLSSTSFGSSLTYRELNTRANRLAYRLRELGVGVDTAVGVCIERSIEMVVSWLAVLKAGGKYVPMDPGMPAARLEFMLTQSEAPLVLAAGNAALSVPEGPWRTLVVDETQWSEDAGSGENLPGGAGPDNASYIIFTSGSTGLPKGVVTRHRNVAELLYGGDAMTVRPDDTVLQIATSAFDVSTFEVWAPLVGGARLVLAPAVKYGPAEIAAWVAEAGVTVLHATASLFALLVDHEPEAFDGLRRLLTGSETVSPGHVARILERCPDLEVVNCWGPTETTTFSVCGAFRRGGVPSGPLPLGVPLANTEVWVVDEAGAPVPIGTPGELCVSGPCLARGYLGRPGLTADRFLPHPFRAGERLYRTGDRGRWSPDGLVEFLGRTDHMVKVRGYRVELGEVEAVLRDHAAVRECAVVTRANNTASVDLVAYLVADGEAPDISELRAWLGQKLPTYMVPRLFVVLDTMPLTRNGKVDRRALPEPDEARPEVAQEYVAPVGVVEQLLADIWSRVLGVDRVGRFDDFFDLGGDSIRSIQVLGQAREAGLAANLATLLGNPTPAGLAAAIEREPVGRDDTRSQPFSMIGDEDRGLLPDGLEDAYPMAQLQIGMVFEMERDPERLPYHNVHTLRMSGSFDESCFRDAVARVVARHPILRTSFALVGYSEPMQLVHAVAEVAVTAADLRAMGEDEAREAVVAYLNAERRTPFNVAVAPLCRMGVHVLSDDVFQWTVTEHHAILDGWSLASVVGEIAEVYRRLLAGEEPRTEPLRSVYRDFVAAERAALASPQSREFWRDRLAELPDVRLPRWPSDRPSALHAEPAAGDRHVHDESRGHGSLISFLPPGLTPRLRDLARECGVPLKAVLLAAHLKVIGMVTGSSDLLVGITANGRLEEADGTDACGLYVNTLPFRMQLPGGSWRGLIRAVFETENEMLVHRRFPMGVLQRELGSSQLFETNFVYTDFRQVGALQSDGAAAEDAAITGTARTNFPLDVTFSREGNADALFVEIDYHADVLTASQVVLYRDYYVRVFEAMVSDSGANHRWVSLLGAQERGLLESWNDNRADVPSTLVHRMFEERVATSPDAVAVEANGESLTYAQLNARANRFARRLRELGVGPDVAVALCFERSLEMITSLLAILKAGGTYVPIEPEYPADRIDFMLTQSASPLVLTAVELRDRIPPGAWQVLPVDDSLWASGDAENLPGGAGPDHGCYIIFTSGSTGKPKGVANRHRNVSELLHGAEFLTLNPDDTLLQLAPLSFDTSTFEVWAPLVGGARLVMAPPGKYGSAEIAQWTAESGATVLHVTAQLFVLLVDHEPQTFDGLRRFLTGSETVSPSHTARILERCPQLEVVNCWGPTETTTFSVCEVYRRGDVRLGPLQLGTPLVNTQVWVLDEFGQPVPIGTPGELYASGPCLARGYLGRPDLSAERFTPHPFQPGERLYRTGDRGSWAVDGKIEFLGRTDHMVKVRGYRIELGEVESALRDHPQVRECVVVTKEKSGTVGVDLVAYLVTDGEEMNVSDLRAWLGQRLPGYMVPRLFVFMDALPLTQRGKVDRRALPAPQESRGQLAQEYVAPVGEIEERLAEVWSRVLGVERVGRHDDFFDLGGDSIRGIQVVGLARDAGFALSVRDLLDAPTLDGLAVKVAQTAPGSAVADSPATEPFSLVSDADRRLLPEGLEDAYPMAQLQLGMVYEMERDRARNAYHNVDTVRLADHFDEALFRDAVARVVARHPVLRTSFDVVGFSEPLQLVHATAQVPFLAFDLRQASAGEQREAVTEYVRDEQGVPFELSSAPLLRMAVHVLADDAFQWTVTEHHAILDGWSLVSTLSEIVDVYRRLRSGEEPDTAPPRSSFRDFIAAERAALDSPESWEFWRDRLAAAPDGRVPRWNGSLGGEAVDGERHVRDEAAGHGALTTALPADLVQELTGFASSAAVPFKTVLLAAHLKAISVLTGSADVLVGLSANGRLEEADGAEARGLFLNTLPLRTRLPEGSWHDLARAVLRAERDMLPHRRVPLAVLQREFGGEEPLFEASFNYTDFHMVERLAQDGTLDPAGADAAITGVARTNFPLDVTFSREVASGSLRLEIDYTPADLSADQVTRIRDYHLRVLRAMVRDGEAHHRATSLLGDGERSLLATWQRTDMSAATVPAHELLRERVAQWPDAVAVESAQGELTFAQLDARSEVLARRLAAAGVRRGDVVGLHLRPGLDAITAVWAVWKSGGAFLPLDPELPSARIELMLDDAAPAVVVTQDASSVPGSWRCLSPGSEADSDVQGVVLPQVGPQDLAYVMYTSGSTGRPKGVMNDHGGVSNYAESLLLPRLRGAGIESGQHARVLTGTSAFISDFFLAQLLTQLDGHGLLVLSTSQDRDPRHLVERAQNRETAVDVIDATTSQIQLMVEAGLLDAPYPPRVMAFGGESCPPDLWAALGANPHVAAHNLYGPAEAAVDATFAETGANASPVIGRPYGTARVYLVDEGIELVPPGAVGEIVIGGPGVGRGYVRRPGVTAAVFVPDPWGEPGDRLYRTGDVARYTADGDIEFLGRNDHQVKILGQRVEPEEVEAALRSHPAVEAAAVTAQKLGGRLQLVAHVVPTGGTVLDRDEIRSYLTGRLPAAAVPTVLVPIDALPMTDGGKLDRKALTVPEGAEAQAARRELVAPRTDTEARIAAVWEPLLGVERVGVFDDFFALGGHSLLAIRLAMRVSRELGVELALQEVFARPTVAGQAELIDGRGVGDSAGRIPQAERAETRTLPASHAQERQWFLWQLAPDSPTYNVPWGFEVHGTLDVAALGSALDALIERHEALRTTLHLDAESGHVVQRIGSVPSSALTAVDVNEADLPALIDEAARRPFDLSTGPMLQVNVWRIAPDRYAVVFVAHHVVVDEWSVEVFERELWALYRSGGDVAAAGLAPLDVQYADYAVWHRDVVERRAEEDLEYWRQALDGAESSWPRQSGTRAQAAVPGADELFRSIAADKLAELDRIRTRAGATEFMLYLAVYSLLVARQSGEQEVVVGIPVSGRTHPDLAPLIGFFVNTLALRVAVRPEDDFATHLERVRTTVMDAFAHQEAPFEQVVRAVAPDRADRANPLFSTIFNFVSAGALSDRVDGVLPDGLTLHELPVPGGAVNKFDLSLSATRMADGLHLSMEFSTELFETQAAEELLSSYADLMEMLSESPQSSVSQLLCASNREQQRIAQWTGDASVPTFKAAVHDLLRQRVAQWPDAVAVESDGEQLSFTQLDAKSEVLARRLAAAGVRRADVVALHLRPGLDAVVAVWAVWKSGGAFLPLDPELPSARLELMLDDAAPSVVVTQDASSVPGSWRCLSPDSDADADVAGVVLPQVGPQDLAYVMYTSGSTGRPKGVMVEHGGLANFAELQIIPRMRRAGVGENARVLTGTSAFISDFFLVQVLPLLDGHRLLVLSATERRDPRHLVERAQDRATAVDVICTTTSQVQLMVDAGLLDAPYPPRLIEPAGEACPPDLWQTLRSLPGLTANNLYGPAETTVEATAANMAAHASPTIGKPYGAVRVYLVNEDLELVPPGAVGEIVIGGPGVGRGYVRRPDLTAKAFVPDPWGEPGDRLYRTGDVGRYSADGAIEFLGRNDHQVKILGQRVEPEEVEAALRSHPAIDAAAVTAQKLSGRLQLVAHLVPTGAAALDRDEIRGYLTGRLPAAAVPTVLVPVTALPMTDNGKLNRKALTVLDDAASELADREVVAPRTETEARVAAVWRKLFDLEHVSIHDDFFALGGHSLLAVRLAMELSRQLGIEVPLADLYTAPTIAEQAARLEAVVGHQAPTGGRTVVRLGGTHGARPLVFVHPIGGTLFRYLELLGEVEDVFEAFGVQGDLGTATDLVGLAGRYADELVTVIGKRGLGDQEPVIAGWSAGGVIAHEIARALADRGVRTHRLVLIDSDPMPTKAEDRESVEQDIAALDALRAEVAEHGPEALLRSDRAERLFATLGVDPASIAGLDGRTTATLIGSWRAMFAGLGAHRPARFDGPADLVLARPEGAVGEDAEGAAIAAAWRELTATLTVTYADGDHFQLLRRPWVKAVADVLRGSTAGPTAQSGSTAQTGD